MPFPAEIPQQQVRAVPDPDSRRQVEAQERYLKSVEQLVGEIQQLRKQADDLALRMHTKSSALRELIRRSPDEGAASLLVFANVHVRLAGAMQQGVKRTIPMDRVVKRAEQDRDDARVREAQELKQKAAREQARALEQSLNVSRGDAFNDLYGDFIDEEEELTDAQ